MKRLLQFGMLTLIVALFMPLHELFETEGEAGGVESDAEFAFFALVFAICLVLLVCRLIAIGVLRLSMICLRAIPRDEMAGPSEAGYTFIFQVPPLLSVPLRI
jgi:hypothetical protein